MALGEISGPDGFLHGRFEIQQPERVGDGGPCPANLAGDLILRELEFVGVLAVGVRFFHRVQVRPLDVLDDRHRELLPIGHLTHDRGHVVQAGELSGTNAPLACDQLISVEDLGHYHRLKDPVDGDAAGKGLQGLLLHALPGLIWIAPDA
jgi:hypothetical protein